MTEPAGLVRARYDFEKGSVLTIDEKEKEKGSVLTIDVSARFWEGCRMPRKLRIEYERAIYHAMNRGDPREPIFLEDSDRELFLETLGQACEKTGWQVHAFCLMPNHFHLVVETPRANLVSGMRWFLGTYTARKRVSSYD